MAFSFFFVDKIDPVNYKDEGKLDAIRERRGYSYEDEVQFYFPFA